MFSSFQEVEQNQGLPFNKTKKQNQGQLNKYRCVNVQLNQSG